MSLATEIAPQLPYLRRYARALTGSQSHGDAFVRATLEAIIASPADFPRDVDTRLALCRVFHAIWASSYVEVAGQEDGTENRYERIAHQRLSHITPLSRQALLLSAMEGFSNEDVGYVIDVPPAQVAELVREALEEINRQTATQVLIIEDEPIIAMDIESIVRDMDHSIVGIAVTRDEAVEMARAHRPGLVLADIQLADDSSGIDAVKDILNDFSVPVIFITAFPERLLTGERPEPTFLITKPFQRAMVKAAIS